MSSSPKLRSGVPRLLPAAVLLAARSTAAQPATVAIEIGLDYEAPSGCPDPSELERQIAERSSRIRVAKTGNSELDFGVQVEAGWRARIAVKSGHGEPTVREVSGETCQEVVAAAALIVAVLADPDAPPPSEVERPGAPPRAPAPKPPPTTMAERELGHREPDAGGWRWAFGLQLTFESAPAPGTLVTPRPFVALERRPGAEVVRPTARLSVARGSSGSIETKSGSAELTWTTARADACAALGGDRSLWAEPCAALELGSLRGRGFSTEDPGDETLFWLAPGALARGGFGVAGRLRFELQLGLVFPLRRYRFFFGPDETAHQVPAVGATGGFGIGVLLP
jgi:hypothetical protein